MTKRILLVDDDEMSRDVLSRRLTRHGYRVVTAGGGIEALDVAGAVVPDLVLMDLSLPDLDGLECTRRLKASQGTHQIPIVAVTAHALLGDRRRALQAGCDEYHAKPVDFQRLVLTIQRLLNRRRMMGPGTRAHQARAWWLEDER